jgi:uncharacterized membrane protein
MANPDTSMSECHICHKLVDSHESMPLAMISHPIDNFIVSDHPELTAGDLICRQCRTDYRLTYMSRSLSAEKGDISSLEQVVLDSLRQEEVLARNVDADFDTKLGFGNRVADKVAAFGGSWRFIIGFGIVLACWISINSVALLTRPFDPFPYILLNLVLSCIAAIQAPVIMMSQNRQEAKDRLRSEHDYQVNLKAEIEIRQLHAKMDQLLKHQWQRLLEIQQLQMELIADQPNRTTPNARLDDGSK